MSPGAVPSVAPIRNVPAPRGDGSFPRPALIAILALLALNLALGWWRYDMAPSVAGYDEAMINDGAVGVARFGELRAPSLEGTPLGSIYALHTPGYLLLQGAIFRIFGLTPLTLRLSSKLPHMAVCILGLVILRRLWNLGVLSTRSTTVVAILWLSDIAGFWIGRQARMESLEELFGLTAAWVLLKRPDDRRHWWLAAVLVGLAFSMHASAILFWIPLLGGLWFFRDRLGWRAATVCAVLPVVILGMVWIAAHRERSLEALALFRTLNSYRTDKGFEWGRWTEFISAGSFLTRRSLALPIAVGGISYWVVLAGWILAAARFREARANRWIAFAIACSVAHALCAQFVTGVLAQRIVLYYPFALLALGIALTSFGRGWERPALVASLAIAVVQFATMFGYANLPGDRSPDRFDALPLPPGTRTVAGSTELWYHFVSRGLPFRIITLERPPYADYWRLHPEHLDDFDAVVLPLDDAMLSWPELARRPRVLFSDFTGTLAICLKPPP